MVILVFYIDDMFLIGDDTKQVFWLEKELKIKFDMMSLGLSSKYLKIQFSHHSNGLGEPSLGGTTRNHFKEWLRNQK
jgi:hypothetical protein